MIDILFIANYKDNAKWMFRKKYLEEIFEHNEIKCEFINIFDNLKYLHSCIIEKKPKLFINTAMLVYSDIMSKLIRSYPQVKFLTINHSSQSDLLRNEYWITYQNHHIKNTLEYENSYFGLVDDRNVIYKILEHPRILTIPNATIIPEESYHDLHNPPTISLICRWGILKNIPNQILSLCLLNKIQPIKVIYCFLDCDESFINEIHEVFPLNYEIVSWKRRDDYIEYIKNEIDIGLQVSFTESFNFVAIEHMLLGKPVVGSSAVRFLPSEWQANADDVENICTIMLYVLEHYEKCSKIARQTSVDKMTINNDLFLRAIKKLL